MFKKKDYREYFDELLKVELHMKQEGEALIKMFTNKDAKQLLRALIADEVRHAKIVKEMKKLI